MELKELLRTYRERIETALDHWLPAEHQKPERLHRAMRYSTLDGGKRVRAVLVYMAGQLFDVPLRRLDAPACAVEMIHAYSLIHDDLPAMDNDDLRRGKPTCHKAFDDATAILAGDALQALAFEVLARDEAMEATPTQRLKMVTELAQAAGSVGMVGGQAIDMEAVGHTLTLEALQTMHRHKTGALLRASIRLGALSHPGLSAAELERLDTYADAIGLAFQIRDDILDVEADTATLGKPQGSDQARNKPTYTSLLGLEGARQKAHELHTAALASLTGFGPSAEPLRGIASYIVERAY
ncbi:MAG TPA: farnesyl diphosphate synthase [Gammaproteobacteria bacterium]